MTAPKADTSGGSLAAQINAELAADPLADDYARVVSQNTEVEQNNAVAPQQVASDEAADTTASE